jgi:hypothetical protein
MQSLSPEKGRVASPARILCAVSVNGLHTDMDSQRGDGGGVEVRAVVEDMDVKGEDRVGPLLGLVVEQLDDAEDLCGLLTPLVGGSIKEKLWGAQTDVVDG